MNKAQKEKLSALSIHLIGCVRLTKHVKRNLKVAYKDFYSEFNIAAVHAKTADDLEMLDVLWETILLAREEIKNG